MTKVTLDSLGFCGCGLPTEAMVFLRDVLQVLNGKQGVDFKSFDAKLGELGLPDGGLRYFVFYMIDHLGLTEHGGSVNGAWLTDKGRDVLAHIEKYGSDYRQWPEESDVG
jgi:hypothetical protein